MIEDDPFRRSEILGLCLSTERMMIMVFNIAQKRVRGQTHDKKV